MDEKKKKKNSAEAKGLINPLLRTAVRPALGTTHSNFKQCFPQNGTAVLKGMTKVCYQQYRALHTARKITPPARTSSRQTAEKNTKRRTNGVKTMDRRPR